MAEAVAQHNISFFKNTGLVIAALLIYLAVAFISYAVGFWWFPLVLVPLPFVLYFGLRSVLFPYQWVLIIVIGSYVGSLFNLFEAAIPISLFQIALFGGIAAFIGNRLITGNLSIRLTGIELELALFSALMFLSCMYSPDPEDGLFWATRIVVTALVLYIIYNSVESIKQIQLVFVVIVLISLVLAVLGAITSFFDTEALVRTIATGFVRTSTRSALTQADPNIFATFFFLPIAFCSCVALSKTNNLLRFVALAAIPILFIGLISTFSRSAWLSTGLVLLIIAAIYRKFRVFGYLGLLGLIIVLAVPDLRYILLNVAQRFLDIFAGASDDSSRVRILQVYAAFGMFFDSYLLGVGWRGYADLATNYYTYQEGLGILLPHNTTYTVMAELGIIGLLLFLFIIFVFLKKSWQTIQDSGDDIWQKAIAVSLFSSFIAFLFLYQFIGGGFADNNVWIIMGFVYALAHIQKNGLDKNKKAWFS